MCATEVSMPAPSLVRAAALSSAIASLLLGCTGSCPEGEILDAASDACVPVDTDTPVDTDPVDTDTVDEPERGPAVLFLTWDIAHVPNDNVVEVICDGRTIFSEDEFAVRKTWEQEFEVADGASCSVRLLDARGGEVPGGSIRNCTTEVAAWDAQRATSVTVADFVAVGCVEGCADPVAENYDPAATLGTDDCVYVLGCNDPRANNYNPEATKDDGTCDFGGFGVIKVSLRTDDYPEDTRLSVRCDGYDVLVRQFNQPFATFEEEVIIDAGFDCDVIVGDAVGDVGPPGRVSTCGVEVAQWGVVQPPPGGPQGPYEAVVASIFTASCSGCTDPFATNYDATAVLDDGTCTLP
jgi:hypothetical protein